MTYETPPAGLMASPAARDYLRAVARDVPSLGDALAEAIVAHGTEIAARAYSGEFDAVWTYGTEHGWSEETTRTLARHALTLLFPVGLSRAHSA